MSMFIQALVIGVTVYSVLLYLIYMAHKREVRRISKLMRERYKKGLWIRRKIPDGTYGTNIFKDCVIEERMPDDYFDENGVY